MAYETVQVEEKNQIGRVTLNRPAARNALNTSMRQEVHHFVARHETRKPQFKGR